jgi:hypothetical protein
LQKFIPKGYEINAEYEKQIQFLQLNKTIYHYRWCDGYQEIPYGKPYTILIYPNLSMIPINSSLLLIFTKPKDYDLRTLFRKHSYLWKYKFPLNYFFIMATDYEQYDTMINVYNESKIFHDILLFNTTNSYHTLILNELLTYHFITNLHLPIRYVIKTDSDMVLNIPKIMKNIYSVSKMNLHSFYGGDCLLSTLGPSKGKHHVPSCVYGKENKAYYARGGLYVITYNLIPSLLLHFRHYPYLFHNEDAMHGVILRSIGYSCINLDQNKWIARYGCQSFNVCITYDSIHPANNKEDKTHLYYQYLLESSRRH